MPWSSGVWRCTRLVAHTATNSMSGNVARRHWKQCRKTPAEAQSCSCLLQIAYHKTASACLLSGNPRDLFPIQHNCHFTTIRVILMSPLNHNVGVATCLMRPAPLRIAMTRPAVASNLISRLRLSIASPCPFASTSTPCCCKTTPRSRCVETQPIPAAAALTAA